MKQNPLRFGASAVTFDFRRGVVLDGWTGQIVDIDEIDGNMAYVVKLEGKTTPIKVWSIQIEPIAPPTTAFDVLTDGDPLT